MNPEPTTKPAAAVPYTEQLGDIILEQVADGRSLREVCQGEGMPSFQSVLRWVAKDESFRAKYMFACDVRAQFLFEGLLQIADTPEIGERVKIGPNGTETTTGDMIERSKLRVHARQWVIGRMSPKRYGDKITQEISGPDGGPIPTAPHDIPQEVIDRIVAARVIADRVQPPADFRGDTPP